VNLVGLDRAIQYAGLLGYIQQGSAILDHPLSRVMTSTSASDDATKKPALIAPAFVATN
jgi:hypothetical protein